MRRVVLLLLLSVRLCGGKEFPNPQKEWRMCGMPRPAFVCDPDFILPRGDAERLDQIAGEFRKSTTCLCSECEGEGGVSLGIFLRHNVSQEAAGQYPSGRALAEMLRRSWGLSTCGNDIVLVLLTQQNISDFILGPAVSEVLPESTASRIVSECRVHFEYGWHYQGLESIANSLNDVLVGLQRQNRPVFRNLVLGIGLGLGFGVLLVLALVALLLVHRHNRKRTKSYCSDIYEGVPTKNNRRKSSFSQEEHLEKLRRLNSSEEEEDYDDAHFVYKPRASSVHFARMHRQLSDVLEESSEDIEVLKRCSASASSSAASQKGSSIPVTEI